MKQGQNTSAQVTCGNIIHPSFSLISTGISSVSLQGIRFITTSSRSWWTYFFHGSYKASNRYNRLRKQYGQCLCSGNLLVNSYHRMRIYTFSMNVLSILDSHLLLSLLSCHSNSSNAYNKRVARIRDQTRLPQ